MLGALLAARSGRAPGSEWGCLHASIVASRPQNTIVVNLSGRQDTRRAVAIFKFQARPRLTTALLPPNSYEVYPGSARYASAPGRIAEVELEYRSPNWSWVMQPRPMDCGGSGRATFVAIMQAADRRKCDDLAS